MPNLYHFFNFRNLVSVKTGLQYQAVCQNHLLVTYGGLRQTPILENMASAQREVQILDLVAAVSNMLFTSNRYPLTASSFMKLPRTKLLCPN